jgi:hypothetical protein
VTILIKWQFRKKSESKSNRMTKGIEAEEEEEEEEDPQNVNVQRQTISK